MVRWHTGRPSGVLCEQRGPRFDLYNECSIAGFSNRACTSMLVVVSRAPKFSCFLLPCSARSSWTFLINSSASVTVAKSPKSLYAMLVLYAKYSSLKISHGSPNKTGRG